MSPNAETEKEALSSSSSSSLEGGKASTTSSSSRSHLLTCAFNQDGGCLAIGTTSGFSVFNLHPAYALSVQRPLQGGIGLVEMLFRCNLMALVGGGPSPQAPPHRVLIWDDHLPKEIGELSFRQTVLRVKLRKDAIAVALRDRVYIYHLADLSLRDKIYTADNPHGLLCLSTQIQDMVLACPSVTTGHVRVELYGLRKTQLMEAHDGALRALALTADGSKLATASTKGTVVRVWDVASGACVQEFRRGVERATINCLCWSWDYAWLACTSDKGTAHVFQVLDKKRSSSSSSSSSLNHKDHQSEDLQHPYHHHHQQQQQQQQQQQHSNHHQVQVHTRAGSHNNPASSKSSGKSFTKRLFSSVKKSVVGEAKNSVCQIRGVPHPEACAFLSDAHQVVAVAGLDADGNGVLLLSEFRIGEEPKRLGYHVLCRSGLLQDESEEARRRRRLRGKVPEIPKTPEAGRLDIGERVDIFKERMEQIQFQEGDDEEDFVAVMTVPLEPKDIQKPSQDEQAKKESVVTMDDDNNDDDDDNNNNNNIEDVLPPNKQQPQGDDETTTPTENKQDSTTADSFRSEPLEEEEEEDNGFRAEPVVEKTETTETQ